MLLSANDPTSRLLPDSSSNWENVKCFGIGGFLVSPFLKALFFNFPRIIIRGFCKMNENKKKITGTLEGVANFGSI